MSISRVLLASLNISLNTFSTKINLSLSVTLTRCKLASSQTLTWTCQRSLLVKMCVLLSWSETSLISTPRRCYCKPLTDKPGINTTSSISLLISKTGATWAMPSSILSTRYTFSTFSKDLMIKSGKSLIAIKFARSPMDVSRARKRWKTTLLTCLLQKEA